MEKLSKKNYKILVVDDKDADTEEAKIFLGQRGFDVETENDSVALWKNIRNNILNLSDYDAMLLDIKMPGKSGQEILQEIGIRGQRNVLPIIILTAYEDHQIAFECFRLGAWDYAVKPASWPDISFRIQRAILTYQKYRQAEQASEHEAKIRECFPNVIGYTRQLRELVNDIILLKNCDERNREFLPRGVLLIGPPGTCKSTIAKEFARIFESDRQIKIANLMDQFYGNTEKYIAEVVQSAAEKSIKIRKPTVITFDEADVLISQFRMKGDNLLHRAFYTLQSELDDAWEKGGIVYFIGTSNSADEIASSLLSRMRIITFPSPDKLQRQMIIERAITSCIQPNLLEPTINFSELAEYAEGLDGRVLNRDIPRKALTQTLTIRKAVSQSDLVRFIQEARQENKISFGESHSQEKIALFQECKWLTANHQIILVNVMLMVDAWGTDSSRAPDKEYHQRSLASRLRSMFELQVEDVRFPACPDVQIAKTDEYKSFRQKVDSELVNTDPAKSPHAEKYKRNYHKIRQVVIAADILLGAYQKRKKLSSMLSEIESKSGIASPKHIRDRIDLPTLILLGIIPEGIPQ